MSQSPAALADHVEQNNLQDDPATKLRFDLFVGASSGPEVEDRWAKNDMISFRAPHQVGKGKRPLSNRREQTADIEDVVKRYQKASTLVALTLVCYIMFLYLSREADDIISSHASRQAFEHVRPLPCPIFIRQP